MNPDDRYLLWNRCIVEHRLLADTADGKVVLAVTPLFLSAGLRELANELLSPEEAENALLDAVGRVYRTAVAGGSGVRELLARDAEGVPTSVAFLAVSVIAAGWMETDEKRTGRAYYSRLADALGVELKGSQPLGFDDKAFEDLWLDLALWLKSEHDRKLVLPEGNPFQRYLALPKAHVLLRRVDIGRLPRFFEAKNYAPGSRPPLDRLAYDLVERGGPWSGFTEHGRGALADASRRALVVHQVANELEHWDGERTDSYGRRVASIEIQLMVRRRAQVSLLARRPPGFPEVLEGAGFVFESADDGWYEEIYLGPGDGSALSTGLRAVSDTEDGRYVLQRPAAEIIPFAPSEEYSGLLSDRVLRLGASSAVLCTHGREAEVAAHLEKIAPGRHTARRDPTLPDGWSLFFDFCPTIIIEPPPSLDQLHVESSVKLVPRGGLRIGGRWAWLHGAPPALQVVGTVRGDITVDGNVVELDDNQCIPSQCISTVGVHVVRIGRQLRQRVSIIEASISPNCKGWDELREDHTRGWAVLPAGRWVVVSQDPDFRDDLVAGRHGSVVCLPEGETWALAVSPARRTRAVLLRQAPHPWASTPPLPPAGRPRRTWVRWADLIYQVAIRRPALDVGPGVPTEAVKPAWQRFSQRARAIKRKLRRAK